MDKPLSEITFKPSYNWNGSLHWNPREEQRLFNSYGKIPTEKLTIIFPDRTYEAIKTKARRLKVPRPHTRYTEEEDKKLLTLANDGLSYKDIADHFQYRTKSSIACRLCKIRKLSEDS